MAVSSGIHTLDWDVQPPYLYPAYASTVKRSPRKPLIPMEHTLSELTGPVYGHDDLDPLDNDLTKNAAKNGEPLGERIIVTGRVLGRVTLPNEQFIIITGQK